MDAPNKSPPVAPTNAHDDTADVDTNNTHKNADHAHDAHDNHGWMNACYELALKALTRAASISKFLSFEAHTTMALADKVSTSNTLAGVAYMPKALARAVIH